VCCRQLGLKKAWPHVAELLTLSGKDKALVFAAIDAASGIDMPEAIPLLENLLNSDDDDIIDAVHEALAMLGAGQFGDEHEEDDW